jgi:hypothetical protein
MGSRGSLISHLLGVVVFIAILAVPVVAQDTITLTISRIAGSIQLCHPNETGVRWITAREGQKIGTGWELRTGAASKVELTLPKDNVVILRENSVLYLDLLLDNGGANLRTGQGGLLVNVRHSLSPGSEFEVKTPSALAVVRGTEYGVACLPGGATAFYGYRGKVQIYNDQGAVYLTAGTTVDVASAMAPSAPKPSGPDAETFLRACNSESGYRSESGGGASVVAQLGKLDRGLNEASSKLAQYEADWQRYSRLDKQTRLVYTYSAAKGLHRQIDGSGAQFRTLLGQTEAGGLWQRAATVDTQTTTVGGYAERLQEKFSGLYTRFERLEQAAQPVVKANHQLLTTLRQVQPEQSAPAWRLTDSDRDGVSDVDETALGLNPQVSNTAAGFIALSGVDDGARLAYPELVAVNFEYTPLKTQLVTRYRLVLEAGPHVWQRTNVGSTTTVQLGPLFGPGGMFTGAVDDNGELKLTWYIVAEIDSEQLLYHISVPAPGCAGISGPALSSIKRTVRIALPRQSGEVVLDLTALDSARLRLGDRVLVRGRISEVSALGKWRVDVVCNPVLLEFLSGAKGAISQNGAVYFAQPKNGVITVTGSAPRDGPGLAGNGELFQLEFTAKETGKLEIAAESVDFSDILGRKIEANPGRKVSLEVLATRSVSSAGRAPPRQRGKN